MTWQGPGGGGEEKQTPTSPTMTSPRMGGPCTMRAPKAGESLGKGGAPHRRVASRATRRPGGAPVGTAWTPDSGCGAAAGYRKALPAHGEAGSRGRARLAAPDDTGQREVLDGDHGDGVASAPQNICKNEDRASTVVAPGRPSVEDPHRSYSPWCRAFASSRRPRSRPHPNHYVFGKV